FLFVLVVELLGDERILLVHLQPLFLLSLVLLNLSLAILRLLRRLIVFVVVVVVVVVVARAVVAVVLLLVVEVRGRVRGREGRVVLAARVRALLVLVARLVHADHAQL